MSSLVATGAGSWNRWATPVAALLLAVFAALAISSLAVKSITGDEIAHLPSGYTYLKTGDFRLNPQHPPLIKAFAALPLLTLDLDPVAGSAGWDEADEWRFGRNFLLDNSEPMRRIVFLGRLPMVAIGVLLGALLFLWARELWSPWVGVAVLFVFTFSPNLLAHTRFVTTDVGASCFTVLALYGLWRFCRGGSAWAAAICGLGVGLALLAKYSGVVTLGVVGVLLVVALIERRLPSSRLALGGALILLEALVLVTVGFDFPHGLSNYLQGFERIYADRNPRWEAFLWGEYSQSGFPYYYLLAWLWKTPLPTICLLGWAFLISPHRTGLSRLDAAFLVAPVLAFNVAGACNQANIGIRHVLPALPFLFLLCGIVAHSLTGSRARYRALFAALGVLYVVGTLRAYPHFLSYFNPLAGGPDNGIRYLDDSNIDWGQDHELLRQYLEAERPEEVRLFALSAVPAEAFGIEAGPIGLRDVVWPRPGVTYVVGAHYLQRSSLYEQIPDFRFGWLDLYEPWEKVGWSLYVYRFSLDPGAPASAGTYLPRSQWYDDAARQLSEILGRHADHRPARLLLAEVLAERGRFRLGEGEPRGGLDDLMRAVLVAPGQPLARRYLDGALAAFEASSSSRSASGDHVEAKLLLREGRLGSAFVAAESAVATDPRHLPAHYLLGSVLARVGVPDRAAEHWETCLAIDADFAPARRDLERLRELQRRLREQRPEAGQS